MKSYDVTIQMKPLQQCFCMVLFVFKYFMKQNLGCLALFGVKRLTPRVKLKVMYFCFTFEAMKTGGVSIIKIFILSTFVSERVHSLTRHFEKNRENCLMEEFCCSVVASSHLLLYKSDHRRLP